MGELALQLGTSVGEGEMPPPPPMAGGRPGPGVMRAEELSLSLTCCSTRRGGSAPYLGSIGELDLDVGLAHEPSLRL